EAGSVNGDQRFVGGDDVGPTSKRRFNGGLGNAIGAANQLHEHVDAAVGGQHYRIIEPTISAEIDSTILVGRARRDRRELHLLIEARRAVSKELRDAATDRA